jgi:hypothetical protein
MGNDDHVAPRRSLFPSSYVKKKKSTKKDLKTSFSPYARQKKIETCLEMTEEEKTEIWWQKTDYDDFAKVSRIISKAMLQGGSDIWLMSNSSKGNGGIKTSPTVKSPTSADTATAIKPIPQMANNSKNVILKATPVVSGGTVTAEGESKAVQNFHETRDKWWCRFGHSRRGLEHVASIMEGKQRHGSVRAAIRAVIQEQRRQRMFQPDGSCDANKLRIVYLQHTHWARVLARASGEEDADAVRCNFDDTKKKSRDFFLKNIFSKDDHLHSIDKSHLPIFMKNVMGISSTTGKLDLDANTLSQIQFRNKAVTSEESMHIKRKDSFAQSADFKVREPPILPAEDLPEEKKCEIDDVIVAPEPQDSPKKLAKQAAGWGIANAEEKADQLKILTGMGLSKPAKLTA